MEVATYVRFQHNIYIFLWPARTKQNTGTWRGKVQNLICSIHKVESALFQGYLLKKGHLMTNWKDRWFVLTPQKLEYFTSRDQTEQKGTILVTKECTVQVINNNK